MFEFKKLCGAIEKMSPLERGVLLTEKSAVVADGVRKLDIIGINPLGALAAFIIGSAVSDGALNEKDYLYLYPSLVKAFGKDFDYSSIKQAYKSAKDIKKEIIRHTEDLIGVISSADENLAADIISLCLLVTAIDGRISLKERRYIRQLLKS